MRRILELAIAAMGVQYWQKVKILFGSSLIGYWPLWEASGSVAADISGNNRNAAYVNSTLSSATSKKGKPCPLFPGSPVGYINLGSDSLYAAADHTQGFISAWVKFTATGGYIFRFGNNSSNIFEIRYGGGGLGIDVNYRAGSTFNANTIRGFWPLNNWINIIASWSLADNLTSIYINGVLPQSVMTPMADTYVGNFAYALAFAYSGSAGTSITGYGSDVLFGNRKITPAEAWTVAGSQGQVVFDGDSRSNLKYAQGLMMTYAFGNTTKQYGYATMGTNGRQLHDLITDAPTKIDPLLKPGNNVLVLWAGLNDCTGGLRTAAQIYADTQTYCAARKAAGWNKVILCSEVDAQGTGCSTWHSTTWPALRALTDADHSFVDGYADLGGDARLQDATNTAYFAADKIHENDVPTNTVYGEVVGPVIASLT
jgi:hypothetical protein